MNEYEGGKVRFQFGLRTLFMLVVIVTIPLAWIAYDVNKSRQRDAVERRWNGRGAHVNFAPDRRIVWLGYRPDAADQVSDEDLVHLQEARRLEHLDLRNTAVTDDGLLHLQQLGELYGVYLSGTKITDAGLTYFGDMTHLRVVDVTHTQVTADGVARLRQEHPDLSVVWDGDH